MHLIICVTKAVMCMWQRWMPARHSIELSKTNYLLFYRKLNVPECIINVLIDWYGNLFSYVRWNGVHNDFLNVDCGVRQGWNLFLISVIFSSNFPFSSSFY